MGTSLCTNKMYFHFNETGVTDIPFLNDGYEYNLRPPAVYDASKADVYTFSMPYSMDGAVELQRYNLNSREITTVTIEAPAVSSITSSGPSAGALIGIIAGATTFAAVALIAIIVILKRRKPPHVAPPPPPHTSC